MQPIQGNRPQRGETSHPEPPTDATMVLNQIGIPNPLDAKCAECCRFPVNERESIEWREFAGNSTASFYIREGSIGQLEGGFAAGRSGMERWGPAQVGMAFSRQSPIFLSPRCAAGVRWVRETPGGIDRR